MKVTRLILCAGCWRSLALLFLMLLTVQFFRSQVGTFSIVEGISMFPTFRPNDLVQARTLPAALQRGDVVIVADDQGGEMIKRIIGLPGETVTIFRGFVYINRQRLSEPYLPAFTYTFKRDQSTESSISWHLKGEQYFVLGDNRLQSADSRHYGPLPRSRIHRIVDAPGNIRPELSDIILLEDGRLARRRAEQKRTRALHSAPTSESH